MKRLCWKETFRRWRRTSQWRFSLTTRCTSATSAGRWRLTSITGDVVTGELPEARSPLLDHGLRQVRVSSPPPSSPGPRCSHHPRQSRNSGVLQMSGQRLPFLRTHCSGDSTFKHWRLRKPRGEWEPGSGDIPAVDSAKRTESRRLSTRATACMGNRVA